MNNKTNNRQKDEVLNEGLREMVKIIDKSSQKSMVRRVPETSTSNSSKHHARAINSLTYTSQSYKDKEMYNTSLVEMVKKIESNSPQNTIIRTTDSISKLNPNPVNNTKTDNSKFINSPFRYINNVLFYNDIAFLNCEIRIEACILDVKERNNKYRCIITVKSQTIIKDIPIGSFLLGNWVFGIVGVAILCKKSQGKELLFLYLNHLVYSFDMSQSISEFQKPGWITLDNQYLYVTKSGVINNTIIRAYSKYGQTFPTLTPVYNSFTHYLKMVGLTKANCAASIIILYTTMSLCHTLLKQADLTPKFILFLNGLRGSYKTSIALAMTQIENKEVTFNLKATSAGIEAGFSHYRDSVMLIDDLAPTQLASDSNKMKSNLELIVRAFGDGTGKKRNYDFVNSVKEPMQYKAEGGAIITGEYVTGCESSLARCLFLDIQHDNVDLNLLSELQKNSNILTDFAITFISALTDLINKKDNNIFSSIINKGKEYRSQLSRNFSNGRYSEYYGQLRATLDLLMYVANSYHLLTYEEIQYYNEIFLKAIDEVIQSNNKRLINNSPLTILCNSIIDCIENGKCAPKQLGEHIQITNNNILEDVNNYYITQSCCCKIFKDYIKENNIQTPEMSSTEVGNLLLKAKIITEFQEGKTTRKAVKMSGYGNIRFMHINKQKLIEQSSQARR